MKNFKRELWQSAKVLIMALVLSVGVQHALAWTGPTSAPPGGNTSAPINISGTAQTKSGGFTAASLSGSGTGLTGTAAGLNIGGSAGTLSGTQYHGPYGGSTAGSYYHLGSWGGNGWGPDVLVERARYADSAGSAPANGGNSSTVSGYGPGSFLKWNTWEYGNYYQTNGDIYMGWAGNWLSTVLSQKAATGGYLVYSCPQLSGGINGSSTCVGGLSANSTCSTTDRDNFSQTYGCTPIGHLVP